MKCKHVQKMLVDYVEDMLEPGKCRRIEEHIAGCESCRRELSVLRKILSIAGEEEVEYPPASVWENFLPDLHRRIEKEAALVFMKQQKQRLYVLPGWIAVAATIVLLLSFYFVQDHSSISSTYTRLPDNSRTAANISPPEMKDGSESAVVAGIISRMLITEAEAEKLRELRNTSQPDIQSSPYIYYDDIMTEMEDEEGNTDSSEDVIQYLQDELEDFDESLMIESYASDFGSI